MTSAPAHPPAAVGDRFRIVIRDERPPFVVTKVSGNIVTARGLPDPVDFNGRIIESDFDGLTKTFPLLRVQQAIAVTLMSGWVV